MTFFSNKYSRILWTILRLYLGYNWVTEAWDKISGPDWIGSNAGAGIDEFLKGTVQKSFESDPPVDGWYAWFVNGFVIPHEKVFSYMIPFGELLVGLALIFGAFTIAALAFGAFMNLNYMMAGSGTPNPAMYSIAILLLIAGANAYVIGLDYFIQPYIKKWWTKIKGNMQSKKKTA